MYNNKCVFFVGVQKPCARVEKKVKGELKSAGSIHWTPTGSLKKNGSLLQLINQVGNTADVCVDISEVPNHEKIKLLSEIRVASNAGKEFHIMDTNSNTGRREIIDSTTFSTLKKEFALN